MIATTCPVGTWQPADMLVNYCSFYDDGTSKGRRRSYGTGLTKQRCWLSQLVSTLTMQPACAHTCIVCALCMHHMCTLHVLYVHCACIVCELCRHRMCTLHAETVGFELTWLL